MSEGINITRYPIFPSSVYAMYLKDDVSEFFNSIVGIKLKNIRLNKIMTAEAVVQDNKKYFHSIYDLYKFEKGIKTDVARMFALLKYYNYDVNFFWQRFS